MTAHIIPASGADPERIADSDCKSCRGTGLIAVDWGYDQCPACRLAARRIEQDRIRAAAEDHVEAAWKSLRDEGADELTLRAMAGDR